MPSGMVWRTQHGQAKFQLRSHYLIGKLNIYQYLLIITNNHKKGEPLSLLTLKNGPWRWRKRFCWRGGWSWWRQAAWSQSCKMLQISRILIGIKVGFTIYSVFNKLASRSCASPKLRQSHWNCRKIGILQLCPVVLAIIFLAFYWTLALHYYFAVSTTSMVTTSSQSCIYQFV